jgi:hypothetical protein
MAIEGPQQLAIQAPPKQQAIHMSLRKAIESPPKQKAISRTRRKAIERAKAKNFPWAERPPTQEDNPIKR